MLTYGCTVRKYEAHAAVVAANVLSYLEDKKPVKVYKGASEDILITNGKVSLLSIVTSKSLSRSPNSLL